MELNGRIRELIAVGAAITANCQPCLEYHTGKARENGASDREIGEAIEVGKTVRQGAAAKMDRLAASMKKGTTASTAEDADCACSAEAQAKVPVGVAGGECDCKGL